MNKLVHAVGRNLEVGMPSQPFGVGREVRLNNLGLRLLSDIDLDVLAEIGAEERPQEAFVALYPTEHVVAASDVPDKNWGTQLLRNGVDDSLSGEGVNVAVLDSGVKGDHPVLQENIIKERVEVDDSGLVAHDSDLLPRDSWWHGTHVASVITGQYGIAPRAKVLSVKVLHRRIGTIESILGGIDYILGRDDVRLVCCSLELGSNDLVELALEKLISAGKIVVAAAGNNGVGSVPLPGSWPGVISVGAITEDLDVWTNSAGGIKNWGASQKLVPTVCAPGALIVGANAEDDGTKLASGTSQAAPAVAGLIALMLQNSPDITAAECEARLLNNAIDLEPSGWDDRSGHGLAKYT